MRHRWLIALCTAALLGACAKPEGGDAAKMEMRVYAVPAERTKVLVDAIGGVLGSFSDKISLGKVSSPSPGQLVVLAPASLQGSIESTLRDLTKANPVEPEPASKDESPLRLSFWSVDAVSGNGADDAPLASLAPALDEVRKQMGPAHFVLHDQTNAVSSPGNNVSRSWLSRSYKDDDGHPVQLQYTLQQKAGGLTLSIQFSDSIPVTTRYNNTASVQYSNIGTNTTTAITPGQALILTQNPLPGDAESKPTSTRLYIVRVDPVKAG